MWKKKTYHFSPSAVTTYIHTYIALYSLISYQMTHEVHRKYISDRNKYITLLSFFFLAYRCDSFIVDLRHSYAVRNMNEIPVLVLLGELSNKTCTATEVHDERISPILHLLFALSE